MSDENLLARAAQAYGIELRYYDTWGRAHEASPEVLRALLGSLGFAAGSDEEIARGLAEREAAERRRPIDPTLVVREDADHLRVRIPAQRNGASIKLEIEWEGGELEHHWFWMPELRTLETLQRGGRGMADEARAFAESAAVGISPRAPDLDAGAGTGDLRRSAADRLSDARESGGAARGGAGGEFVWAALGTQLGVRRFYGFGGAD